MSDLPPLPKGFLVEPVPNEAAAAWIRDKPAVSSSVFKRLLPELKSRAITVAGIESAGVLRDIREAIARVPEGADWDKEKRKIADLVHPYVSDPAEPTNKKAARRKAELLLRTHGFQSYSIGQHQVMREQQDVFPWWQYLTMTDELVRPTHAELHKLILPASSPFWAKHTPPWDWGCRCRKVPLLPEEVEEQRRAEAKKPPEAKTVIEGEALRYLEDQQKLDRGPNKIFDLTPPSDKRPDAFLFEPDSLRLTPDQLATRYDAQTWADFRAWAEVIKIERGGSLTVWQWLLGQVGTPDAAPAVQPSSTGVRRLTDIVSDLAKLYAAQQQAERQVQSSIAAWNVARRSGASQDQLETFAESARQAVQAYEDSLVQQRAIVSIPVGERGNVRWVGPIPSSCQTKAEEGAALAATYTHADLLPRLGVELSLKKRASHSKGTIFINGGTSVSIVMHEITHGTEQQTADVLKAALAFLKHRAGNEPLRLLRKLTGLKDYKLDEFAYKDEWEAKGGHIYSGKSYGGRATELLTTGIERLHAGPARFAAEDPEYFLFVLSTLQKL